MSNVPHVVLAAAPAWSAFSMRLSWPAIDFTHRHAGHLRTLSVLAAKLVAERQVVVTFVVMNWMNVLGKVEAEVARSLRDVESPKGTFRWAHIIRCWPDLLTLGVERLLLANHRLLPISWTC